MTWFKLALREILNNRRFAIFFSLNLALGLAGFIILDSFKLSLQNELRSGSQALLKADFVIHFANRMATNDELATIDQLIEGQGITRTDSLRLFSMAATDSGSRLSRLMTIAEGFPLYGEIVLRQGGSINQNTAKDILSERKAWVYPELLVQLNLKIGDKIKLGDAFFEVTDVVDQDPAAIGQAFSFAPGIYIGEKFLEETNLLKPTSRFRQTLAYKLPAETDLIEISDRLKDRLTSPEVEVTTHFEASEQLERSLTSVTDYLGLVALVALFLAAMGSAYLFRSFLLRRLKEVAILMSLGALGKQARRVYLLQLIILGFLAATLAIGLSAAFMPVIPSLAKGLLPMSLAPQVNIRNILIGYAMGTLGSILICLPLLSRIKSLKPTALFQEAAQFKIDFSLKYILQLLPVLFLYWALAIWEANSVVVGSIFIGTFLGAAFIFTLIGFWIFQQFSQIEAKNHLVLRLALRNLSRNKLTTSACFLAISLGSMLIALVPQIRDTLLEEVSSPKGYTQPSLFLIDVQEDQLEGLKQFLTEKKVELDYVSPMVQARITKVNDRNFERYNKNSRLTREQQAREWAQTRGQNLTYRKGLSQSERLNAGKPFSGKFNSDSGKLAEISVEMRYAKRLDIALGDHLTFDIQGVPIEAVVVNTRRVKWTTFQPNFFIQFQEGVLEDAPKTYLASIPNVEGDEKFKLQNAIVQTYPNISIIDITNAITRAVDIINKMGWIIRLMAYLAIFSGLVVLFSIASHQAQSRRWDINLFKVLGCRFADIRSMILVEFGILSMLACLCGTLGSLLVSFIFTKVIFDSPWAVQWSIPLLSILGVSVMSVMISLLATIGVLREKPLALLNTAQNQ